MSLLKEAKSRTIFVKPPSEAPQLHNVVKPDLCWASGCDGCTEATAASKRERERKKSKERRLRFGLGFI